MLNYNLLISLALVLLINLFGCKNARKQPEIIQMSPEIINDDLITHFPGRLIVDDKFIVWNNIGASNNFLHIHSIENGIELGKGGKLGSGPNEFLTPKLSSIRNRCIFVWDLNSNKEAMIPIDSVLSNASQTIFQKGRDKALVHNIVIVNDSIRVAIQATDSTLFQLWSPEGEINFGKTPIQERVLNHYDIYQGSILFNEERNLLVHTNIPFPYLAIYKFKNNSFVLEKENIMYEEVTIKQNNFIRDGAKRGIWESTLTKNYIACLQRDYATDNTDESTIGRDFTKAPRTIFLYNYNGELKKIIKSEYPVIRIASNTTNDNIYAIVIDLEFKIAKFEL
jgi:hypothetical protein